MTDTAEPIRHLVAKVRRLEPGPAAPERGQAWVALRPFPPGLEPSFIGSAWFWHDGRPLPDLPALRLRPVGTSDKDAAPLRYLNLFFDPQLGGTALLDTEAGWRRLDFLFTLPEARGPDARAPLAVSVLASRGTEDGAGSMPAGTLDVADGVWRFRPASALPPMLVPVPPAPLRPGFVGGAPKSGTTWMQMLLNQHDQVFATGEGALLRQATMRPYRANNWWVPPATSQATLNHFGNQAVLMRMLQTYREALGCSWVIDKSPGNARLYRLILAYAPRAKLVHCVRHPLDVLVSRLHHEASIVSGGPVSHEMGAHAGAVRRLPALLAGPRPLALDAETWAAVETILDEYAEFQAEALATLQARTGRLLIVRYEDMLHDAAAAAARVFAHLELPATPAQVASCVRNVSFANLRERREGRPHSFFRSGTEGQFDAALTAADQARALAHLAQRLPQLSALGYAA